jgi:hypothetical protein
MTREDIVAVLKAGKVLVVAHNKNEKATLAIISSLGEKVKTELVIAEQSSWLEVRWHS